MSEDIFPIPKFRLGQTVFGIEVAYLPSTCPGCKGKKEILHEGCSFRCAKCGGSGKIGGRRPKHSVVPAKTIVAIDLRIRSCGTLSEVCYGVNGFNWGQIPENLLFGTLEEARAYCDEQDAKNPVS